MRKKRTISSAERMRRLRASRKRSLIAWRIAKGNTKTQAEQMAEANVRREQYLSEAGGMFPERIKLKPAGPTLCAGDVMRNAIAATSVYRKEQCEPRPGYRKPQNEPRHGSNYHG